MTWDGVVNASCYILVRQGTPDLGPVGSLNDRKMVGAARTWRDRNELDRRFRQRGRINLHCTAALLVPCVEPCKLHRQDRGLQRVQSAVGADNIMPILVVLPPAMIACGAYSAGEARIIRHDRAGITEGSKILSRIEAEATCMR